MEKVLVQLVAFYRLSFGAFLRILQVKLETLKHGVTYLVQLRAGVFRRHLFLRGIFL